MGFFGGLLLCFLSNYALTKHYNQVSQKESVQWRPPLASAAIVISPTTTRTVLSVNNNAIHSNSFLPPSEWNELSSISKERLSDVLSWENLSKFDYEYIFEVNELTKGHPLLFMSWAIFTSPQAQRILQKDQPPPNREVYNFMDTFNLDSSKFLNFVRRIEDQYQDNLYHNRIHAADVVQTIHALLRRSPSSSNYSDIQILSILLAAIVHDVGHDGTNNEFHVQTQSSLALTYKNESVLENHHIHLGLQMIQDSGLLSHLPKDTQSQIQSMIKEAVLHTDMAFHQQQIKEAEERSQSLEQTDDDTWKSLVYLMHLSDISNSAKSSFLTWTDGVLEEFFLQGDKQRDLNLQVSALHDRRTVDRATCQTNFIKFSVLPAFSAVTFTDETIMNRLKANLKYWESIIQQ